MNNNSWFTNFPQVLYDNGDGSQNLVTNIFHYIRFIDSILDNVYVYYEYQIKDSDTPESIATKYYGDPDYFWLIFLANNLSSRYTDWPLSSNEFSNYIISKYGSLQAAQNTLDHYEDSLGNPFDPDSITNPLVIKGSIVNAYNNAGQGYMVFPLALIDSINAENYSPIIITVLSGAAAGASKTVSSLSDTLATLNSQWTTVPAPGDLFQVGPYSVTTYTSVSVYDKEYADNENKRTIKLIDKQYVPQINQEFLNILRNLT